MKLGLLGLAIPLLAQQGVNFYSVEKERALGQQAASEVKRQAKPLSNPVVDGYVKRIGVELVSQLTQAPFEYQFEVIGDSVHVEPTSLPGGYILVPVRLFVTAQDEAEFVGMLAHSIGHAALLHGTRAATRGQMVNMASIPVIFMGGWAGSHVDSQNLQMLTPIALVEFQRTYELEADRFGLRLASRAGYDAAGFDRYVRRTHPADSTMSPLPARERRLAGLQEVLASLPSPTDLPSGDEFRHIRQLVRSTLEPSEQRRAPTLKR